MTPEQIEAMRQHLITIHKHLRLTSLGMLANFYYLRRSLHTFVVIHHYDLMDAEDLFIPYIRFMIGDIEGLEIHGVSDERVFSGAKGRE